MTKLRACARVRDPLQPLPQVAMYRFLKVTSDNRMEEETLTHLSNAYRLCVPQDQTHAHVKMLHAVRDEIANSPVPVLVTYLDAPDSAGIYAAYYIQPIPLGINTPIPNLGAFPFLGPAQQLSPIR